MNNEISLSGYAISLIPNYSFIIHFCKILVEPFCCCCFLAHSTFI